MTAIKGYVVRGRDRHDNVVTGDGIETIEAAVRATRTLAGCTDVAIFRVHADGREEKVPDYEDALGQLASLKDHLCLADAQCDAWARLARARGAAMQTFDDDHPECLAAREALEALGVVVLPEVQSPITDAAIDAAVAGAKEQPWNWCPKCKTTVDDDMRTGEFFDGSEGTCLECRTVYVAVAYSDDSWALVAREENDRDEGDDEANDAPEDHEEGQ